MPGHSGDISQPSVIGDADLPPEPEFIYPEGPRSAVLAKPSIYPLLMPASLIAKRLIQKIGGLATGLRFSADREFVRRAVFAGGVINVSACCYHRRISLAVLDARPRQRTLLPCAERVTDKAAGSSGRTSRECWPASRRTCRPSLRGRRPV